LLFNLLILLSLNCNPCEFYLIENNLAKFYNISDWIPHWHFQTGGTRSKLVVAHPETGILYFFKTSLKKSKIDYRHEFWSEIVASEVGQLLGFNTLVYDIAYYKTDIGCLSRSMIESDENELLEGIRYLTGYDNTYNPYNKSSYSSYTFQFICNSLKYYDLEVGVFELLKVVVFDAIIGNSDRHQENWGFISYKKGRDEVVFSPIYDSGSCLGREIGDSKVEQMLTDRLMLDAYISRGKCEIRWDGCHLTHYEFIKLLKCAYEKQISYILDRVISQFEEQLIEKVVCNVDVNLPSELEHFKLPDLRKELIVKMITLRVNKLKELL